MTTKQEIKAKLPEFLELHGYSLKKPFRCINPAHEDIHPSMAYDKARNVCHCFACGKTYDIFDCIAALYGLSSFPDQFKKACELLNLSDTQATSKATNATSAAKKERKDYLSYYKSLPKNYTYLLNRGIRKEIQDHFMVGYAPIWKPDDKPNAPISERIIIPRSRFCYLARALDDNNPYQKMAVGGIDIFNKKALSKYNAIVVTEGEIDCMSVIECGFPAVALCSVTNTNGLLWAAKRAKTENFYLMLDNDKAGKEATQAIMAMLLNIGKNVKIISYPDQYKDPNDFLIRSKGFMSGTLRKVIDKDSLK
jgi:DNA primase